jgi:hypothetical protein
MAFFVRNLSGVMGLYAREVGVGPDSVVGVKASADQGTCGARDAQEGIIG